MFSKASLVLHKIHQTFKFVPVTTRTLDQFNRICFKNVQPDLAIVANGGMILVNGELDLEWNKHIQDTLKSITPFDVMKRKVEHLSELEGFKKFGNADGLFFYIVMHTNQYDVAAVEAFSNEFSLNGWGVHIHGRKIYFIPDCISKGHALQYIKDKYGFSTIVAAGDSSLDLPLQDVADAFYVPKHGGIADQVRKDQVPPENGLHSGLYILNRALDFLEK